MATKPIPRTCGVALGAPAPRQRLHRALFWIAMGGPAGFPLTSALYGQAVVLAEPRPHPAVPAVIDAFSDYPLVAIGESHRNQQVHDFIVALLRDRRFLPNGGDIVVEFGNARYQATSDRYTRGDTVAADDLRRIWRDAINILVWDAPVYERLFATVRSVNRTRGPTARLRVLLADPPIDWTATHDRAQWEHIATTRDEYAAAVIERDVLARGRPALLVFGEAHVAREKAFDAYGTTHPGLHVPNLAERLEERHPGATLLIWSHMSGWMTNDVDARLARWTIPSLARLKGTWLGNAHVGPPSGTPSLEALADAFLYLGPTAAMTSSMPPREIYRDTTYLRELLRRNAIQGGANTAELEGLRKRFLQGRPQ